MVEISGTNKGRPINQGADVDLRCIPVSGVPDPTLSWDASTVPSNSLQRREGNAISIEIFRVQGSFCIDCVGTNAAGTTRESECIQVLSKCVLHQPLIYLSSYSIKPEKSSAAIALQRYHHCPKYACYEF